MKPRYRRPGAGVWILVVPNHQYQSVWGRLLGYGQLILRGTGVGVITGQELVPKVLTLVSRLVFLLVTEFS